MNDMNDMEQEQNNGALMASENAKSGGVAETSAQAREIAEIQSAMIIARRFPRDEAKCLDGILTLCQRPSLAEKAVYSYSKGGSEVSGPSIHLAKAILQRWKNCTAGIRELEDNGRESLVEAYAYDLENNYKETKQFRVPHMRHTKKGDYRLTDPREVYELVANNGSRRERACILSIIPGDVVDAAVDECNRTLKASADCSPENVKKMAGLFLDKFKVTKSQIEARIQRRIDTITPAQMVSLRNIYNSLSDGMSDPSDWFSQEQADNGAAQEPVSGKTAQKPASLREALAQSRRPQEAAPARKPADVPSDAGNEPAEASDPDADLFG